MFTMPTQLPNISHTENTEKKYLTGLTPPCAGQAWINKIITEMILELQVWYLQIQ